MTLRKEILTLQQQKPVTGLTIDLHEQYTENYHRTISPLHPSYTRLISTIGTTANLRLSGAWRLRECHLGAPQYIEAVNCSRAEITAQVMEECESIDLSDEQGRCTQHGAVAAGAALIGQWLAQVTEQASGLCSVEFASVDDFKAFFDPHTGTMWQDGEAEKRVGGLRLRVADADALAAALGEEVMEDVVDAEGCVKPDAVCFVGGECLEGNALRGTADGCAVTGYGYGVLHARLWQKPDVLLSEMCVALGVGAVSDGGEYHGESCPEGAQLKGSLAKLRELTEEEMSKVYEVVALFPALAAVLAQYHAVAPVVAERPELAPIIAEWPSVVNSLVETGKETWLTIPNNATNGYINGIALPYQWNQIGKVEMAIQDLDGTNNWMLFAQWSGTTVNGSFLYHNGQSGFSNVVRTPAISDRKAKNYTTFTFTGPAQRAHIGSWNEGNWSRNMRASYFRIYSTSGEMLMNLVPYFKDGVYGFIDLLHIDTFLTNTGKGTFSVSIESK